MILAFQPRRLQVKAVGRGTQPRTTRRCDRKRNRSSDPDQCACRDWSAMPRPCKRPLRRRSPVVVRTCYRASSCGASTSASRTLGPRCASQYRMADTCIGKRAGGCVSHACRGPTPPPPPLVLAPIPYRAGALLILLAPGPHEHAVA